MFIHEFKGCLHKSCITLLCTNNDTAFMQAESVLVQYDVLRLTSFIFVHTFRYIILLEKYKNNNNNNDNNNNNNNNNNNRIERRYSRFFTISSQRCELSPTRTLKWPRRNCVQITCNTSSAYHVQHVVLHAIWYEGTAQLLSLIELKSHLFELYFVG